MPKITAIIIDTIKLFIHLKMLLNTNLKNCSLDIILCISFKTSKKEGKSSLLLKLIATTCQTNIITAIEIIKYFLFLNEYCVIPVSYTHLLNLIPQKLLVYLIPSYFSQLN